jgi:hypothetical protein
MTDNAHDQAKRAAANSQTVALVVLSIISVTLLINFGVSIFHNLTTTADASFAERFRSTMAVAISVLPAALFIGALARLRTALREYEKGDFFSHASARAVRKAGEDATLAMLAKMLIVPSILRFTSGDSQVSFHFELEDLAVLSVVVFVAAVGRVLMLAAAIKADNDQIV